MGLKVFMMCLFGLISGAQAASKNIQNSVQIDKLSDTTIEVIITGYIEPEAIHQALVVYPNRIHITQVILAPHIKAQLENYNNAAWMWEYPWIMRPLIKEEAQQWFQELITSGCSAFSFGMVPDNFNFE